MKIVRRKDIPHRGGIHPYVKLYPDGLYFTVACVNKFDLKKNEHITFLNEDKRWEFCKTDDTEEFTLVNGNDNPGLWIKSTGLAKMIVKSMDVRPNQSLYVKDTGRQLNGKAIISLLPKEPFL